MIRPTRNETFMEMARVISKRGTCPRRRVGCILVDFNHHIVATGYNGAPRGMTHCIDHPCPGANYPPGKGYDKCEAVHAEQNALLQCPDVHVIKSAYITCSPCMTCVKLLMNTSCIYIYIADIHDSWNNAEGLWSKYRDPAGFRRV